MGNQVFIQVWLIRYFVECERRILIFSKLDLRYTDAAFDYCAVWKDQARSSLAVVDVVADASYVSSSAIVQGPVGFFLVSTWPMCDTIDAIG